MGIGQLLTMQSPEIKKIEPSNSLKIKISPNNLTLVVVKHLSGKVLNYFNYDFEKSIPEEDLSIKLKSAIEESNIDSNNIISVKLYVNNKLSCIIPDNLFDKKLGLEYLKYNSKLLKNDTSSYDTIEEIEAVNVYLPYINVNNFILDKYGAFDYYHYSTIFIKKILKINNRSKKTNLYLNFDRNSFQISIIKTQKLIYFNTFKFTSPNDALYFILYVIKQNKINTNKSEILCFGNIIENDEKHKLFSQFFNNIKIKRFEKENIENIEIKKEDVDFLIV